FMKDWLGEEESYLHTMLEQERRRYDSCQHCGQADVTWRCLSCLGVRETCQSCMYSTHRKLLFHALEIWNKDHWEAASSTSLGLAINVGHDGDICPHADLPSWHKGNHDADNWMDVDDADAQSSMHAESNTHTESNKVVAQEIMDYRRGKQLKLYADADADDNRDNRRRRQQTHITVVDVSGVFELPINWCNCEPKTAHHKQLLNMRLYPGSQKSPRTAFTFDVLDDFMVANLETKVAPNAYWRRLIRVTNTYHPDVVPDRYRELTRCARQWLRLTTRYQHGHGYGLQEEETSVGSLAPFCVACPQPGKNLPEDWKDTGPKWLHYRHLVLDGNFKQQNLHMRRPENDVGFADGLAYTVNKENYESHLASTHRNYSKSTCNNHRATQSKRRTNHLQSTGIVSVACARHGGFVPNATADLKAGESQANSDAVASNAGWQWPLLLGVILYYDIMCQYIINFAKRMKKSKHLSWPDGVELIPAIGLFHVHGHKDECVAKFSPTFIEGTGHVDGEVLETLWAALNDIAASTLNMSTSWRVDVLNAHMRWSNLRKIMEIVKTTSQRWKKALQRYADALEDYNDFTDVCPEDKVKEWKALIKKAYADRHNNLDANMLFDVKIGQLPTRAACSETLSKTLSQRKDRIARGHSSSIDKDKDDLTDIIRWMNLGIDIEEFQLRIQSFIRQMGRRVQRGDPARLEADRRRLMIMIDAFLEEAPAYMGELIVGRDNAVTITLDITGGDNVDIIASSHGFDDHLDQDDNAEDDSDAAQIKPEQRTIGLPSAFGRKECKAHGLGRLTAIEMELRKGQAHDAIQKLREYIGKKSVLYRTDIRSARRSQHKAEAARQRVDAQTAKINIHRLYYNRAREAMLELAKKPRKIKEYKLMTIQDLTASTSLLNPSERGNRHRGLPWLWSLDI
ncbi:hypothetical protein CONPUDRAFT_22788, partial [Coniophora puteana RWD-64-598 SS2]